MGKIVIDSYGDRHHPLISLIYFVLVMAMIMSVENPLVRSLFLVVGFIFLLYLEQGRHWLKHVHFIVLLIVLAGFFNALFVKSGATWLIDYRFSLLGNTYRYRVTLESFLFGLSYGTMFAALLTWFQVMGYVLTPEKIRYLLGKRWPLLALLLTMILRMLPQLRHLMDESQLNAKGIGQFGQSKRTLKNSLRQGRALFFNLWGVTLENGLRLSDAMLSRAYTGGRRTSFYNYKWRWQETSFLILLVIFGSYWLFLKASGAFDFYYYVRVAHLFDTQKKAAGYGLTLSILLLPVCISLKEWFKWKYFLSKM